MTALSVAESLVALLGVPQGSGTLGRAGVEATRVLPWKDNGKDTDSPVFDGINEG